MDSAVICLPLPDQAGDVVTHAAPGGGGGGQAITIGIQFGIVKATVAVGWLVMGGVPALMTVLQGIDVARAGGVIGHRVVAAPGDAGVV